MDLGDSGWKTFAKTSLDAGPWHLVASRRLHSRLRPNAGIDMNRKNAGKG
jgi:hypothetical protein